MRTWIWELGLLDTDFETTVMIEILDPYGWDCRRRMLSSCWSVKCFCIILEEYMLCSLKIHKIELGYLNINHCFYCRNTDLHIHAWKCGHIWVQCWVLHNLQLSSSCVAWYSEFEMGVLLELDELVRSTKTFAWNVLNPAAFLLLWDLMI